jgi:hypothetical protein
VAALDGMRRDQIGLELSSAQQLRQLGDIRRDLSRLVFAEQLGRWRHLWRAPCAVLPIVSLKTHNFRAVSFRQSVVANHSRAGVEATLRFFKLAHRPVGNGGKPRAGLSRADSQSHSFCVRSKAARMEAAGGYPAKERPPASMPVQTTGVIVLGYGMRSRSFLIRFLKPIPCGDPR